jgi:predicted small lipoprotein YifL
MKRLVALLFVVSVLAACGNKGPLVMPGPAPAPVVVPPAEQPAPAEPAKTESGTPAR